MTQTRTYSLAVEPQDDGYLAYFPALPGCHTSGRTFEEAVKNAEEALAVYIETLTAHGDPVPEEINIEEPVSLGVTVRTPVIT
jgi:antitoxin HicB